MPAPGPGEVAIDVRAAGVNPTDYKGIVGYQGRDESRLPLPIGYEVAGVVAAVGDGAALATGPVSVGDEVVAFRVTGGYSERLNVPAPDVFHKPERLDWPEAANLFLVAATAADVLRVVPVERGQTVVVHGGSGSVGVVLLRCCATPACGRSPPRRPAAPRSCAGSAASRSSTATASSSGCATPHPTATTRRTTASAPTRPSTPRSPSCRATAW
ncbi:hypothetical protein GCM10025868_16280 [Angustibacter aerolatus]|uniref:Alcohol dehydrogenase-like N-terminal domain-containing protein n=1 Tax=Angustibacter aerolatus TaxID=1162965 RepID=A0ABQ6JDW8_9ACTN|nr:hypothetical protein GCM10025868_16280 [Angustibacter aerolatus]